MGFFLKQQLKSECITKKIKNQMKNWKQSKTLMFNFLVSVLAILPMIDVDILTAVGITNPLAYYKVLVVVTAIANKFLRIITTEAIK